MSSLATCPLAFRRLLAALLLGLCAAASADWPLYRGGPNQLGVAAGPLAAKPKRVWRFKTRGPILSSPVVAQGRVYVGSEDKYVYAFNLKDGKKLWSFGTKAPVDAPPCVVDGLVVIGSTDGNLYAIDAVTGKMRWKYATEDKIAGAANAAPAPDGKGSWVVVGSYDSRLHCVIWIP